MMMATNKGSKILFAQSDAPSMVRIGYHTAFWMVLFLILLLVDMAMFEGIKSWTLEIISLSFFAFIVYFNLLYLIPNYLTKERFLTYIGLLLATALVLSSLRVVFYFIHFNNNPSMQSHALEANIALYLPLTITIGGGSTILKIITDWFRQLREKQELATQTMQSELRFLKSQINPHFLFNTLNNLYALTLKKSDKAPEIVIKLSEMMRYMLYECNEKRVPLQKEVNYLRNYLDLERLRQNDDIEINFLVEGQVSDQQVAPLLFIPFLENSFKHGLNTQLKNGFVNILLEVDEQHVEFQIENSKGQTVLQPDNRPSGGIGLVNVRRRLDLIYPDRYELKVSNNPNTFSVHLTVNLD